MVKFHVRDLISYYRGQTSSPDPQDCVSTVAVPERVDVRANVIQNLISEMRRGACHDPRDCFVKVVSSFGAKFFDDGFLEREISLISGLILLQPEELLEVGVEVRWY